MKIIFVTAGWTVLHTPGGNICLSPGSVVVIPSGLGCAGTPLTFTRTTTLYLHDELVASHLPWLPLAHPLVQHLTAAHHGATKVGVVRLGEATSRAILPLLRIITELSRTGCSALALMARIADLLDALTYANSGGRSGTDIVRDRALIPRRAVSEAIRALYEHLDHPWTANELARTVALSKSQLARVFRQDVGSSPAAFLRTARADRMAELLASDDLTVSEAARRVGWSNVSVAGRTFRARYGQSATDFARSIRRTVITRDTMTTPGGRPAASIRSSGAADA